MHAAISTHTLPNKTKDVEKSETPAAIYSYNEPLTHTHIEYRSRVWGGLLYMYVTLGRTGRICVLYMYALKKVGARPQSQAWELNLV